MNTPMQSPSYPMAFQVQSCVDSDYQIEQPSKVTFFFSLQLPE
uniref:DUF5060 domain-containing protein n=1 Tax=Heterorhabditis bacteriophora TaxID=37862 RepID=A0A1I7XCN6_HETBA